jgi:hypothetical protein
MIGVTVGTGDYEETAVLAGARARAMTGLDIEFFDYGMLRKAGIADPYSARLAIFDLVDVDAVLYFDADIVMLKPWSPRSWEGCPSFVAVRDQYVGRSTIDEDLPRDNYVNSGLFIAQRRAHAAVLSDARELWKLEGDRLEMKDQTALNRALRRADVRVEYLPEFYNFMRYHLKESPADTEVLNAHYTPHGRAIAHQHLLRLLAHENLGYCLKVHI